VAKGEPLFELDTEGRRRRSRPRRRRPAQDAAPRARCPWVRRSLSSAAEGGDVTEAARTLCYKGSSERRRRRGAGGADKRSSRPAPSKNGRVKARHLERRIRVSAGIRRYPDQAEPALKGTDSEEDVESARGVAPSKKVKSCYKACPFGRGREHTDQTSASDCEPGSRGHPQDRSRLLPAPDTGRRNKALKSAGSRSARARPRRQRHRHPTSHEVCAQDPSAPPRGERGVHRGRDPNPSESNVGLAVAEPHGLS